MYNRWIYSDELCHHGVKNQRWGVRNGPPYPLDRSKSDGHKLLKGDGSPQGKKRYKTSEKTAHKRAERKARTELKESPEKTEKLRRAKDKDEYDLYFLEMVQNETWQDDKKRMLKEYSEFLDDKDAYNDKSFERFKERIKNSSADPKTLSKADFDGESPYQHSSNMFNTKISSAEPKKSLKDRITSFKDRLLGGNKKTTEKINYSVEPKTTEKARTRNGEEYEIFDWDGEGQETIKRFKASPERHIGNAKRAALSEAREIISWYADEHPEAKAWMNASNQKLGKRVGLRYVNAGSNGSLTLIFGDTHGDLLGHEVEVEYDLRRNKVIRTSVQG